MGRPSLYYEKVYPYLKQIAEWRKDMTVADIIKKLKVKKTAFYEYVNKYPELADALKNGEVELGKQALSNLMKRANGYDYTEEKEIYERQYDLDGNLILDEDGKPLLVMTRLEKHKKHQPGDVGANIILAKNYVEGFSNDPAKDKREAERLQMDKDKQDTNNSYE